MSNSRNLKPYYILKHPTATEVLGFEGSLLFTHFKNSNSYLNWGAVWPRCSKVAPGLFLTKIPEGNEPQELCDKVKAEKGQLEFEKVEAFISQYRKKFEKQLQEETGRIGLVLATLLHQELTYKKIASIKEWYDRNIKHFLLPMTDNTADAGDDNICAAVWEMHESRENGDAVVVHCKAGRGRSFMVMVIYLAVFVFTESSVEEIIAYIKLLRIQVDMHDVQFDTAKRVVERLKKEIQEPSNHEKNKSWQSVEDYLRSRELEVTQTQFLSTKLLAMFSIQKAWEDNKNISEAVQKLFTNILTSENWYPDLVNELIKDSDNNNSTSIDETKLSAYLDFLDRAIQEIMDPDTREFETLRLNFFKEVTKHIASVCDISLGDVIAQAKQLKLSPKIHKAHSNLTQFCHRSSSDLSPHSGQSPLIGMGKFSTSPPKPSVLQSPAELSEEPTSEPTSTSPSMSRRQPSQS